jgi:hypothetical protein
LMMASLASAIRRRTVLLLTIEKQGRGRGQYRMLHVLWPEHPRDRQQHLAHPVLMG